MLQKSSEAEKDVEQDVKVIMETLESDVLSDASEKPLSELKLVKRAMRVAHYSVVVCLLAVMLFAWVSSYYVINLETKFSQSSAEMFAQLSGRIGKIEAVTRPAPQVPKFANFQVPDGAPRLGSADAQVTVVEFADFQCPFCSRFQQLVYPQLKAEYVDTGKASFVYQDFAFLGEESKLSGQAAKCASEQGKFWEYHDYLFSHQKGENEGAFSVKNLKTFARNLKLNYSDFGACLDSGKYATVVDAETKSGRDIGVTGTPTVLVNGKVMVGAQPYASFKQAIDEALAK